jgi:hypothetical protein
MLPKYVKAIERAPGGIIALVLSTLIVFLTGADKSVRLIVRRISAISLFDNPICQKYSGQSAGSRLHSAWHAAFV